MINFRSVSKSAAIHHDALCFAAPKMAEYMMDKAQELHLFLKDKWLADYPTSRAELDKILSIMKDAWIEAVKDGE